MLRRKSKMISFRVSPDEYVRLRDACTAQGIESVSALARVAMENVIRSRAAADPIPDQIDDLRQRVATLAAEIDRLARTVGSTAPPFHASGD